MQNRKALKILQLLESNVDEVHLTSSFQKELFFVSSRLRVKVGIDPTMSLIHLGHTVVLRKAKQFQELGHSIILIVGNATSLIGDPSGRISARPVLDAEEINGHSHYLLNQVSLLLDYAKTEIKFNDSWTRFVGIGLLINLMTAFPLVQMLEKSYFAARLKEGSPVFPHELIYPLLQGYDSVIIRSDIEVGGSDQKSNFIIGRALQLKYFQKEQQIVMMMLVKGTDGFKMSKSGRNAILIDERGSVLLNKVRKLLTSDVWNYLATTLLVSQNELLMLRSLELNKCNFSFCKVLLAIRIIFVGQFSASSCKLLFKNLTGKS